MRSNFCENEIGAYRQQVDTALSFTKKMLAAARTNNWEQVIMLEKSRQPILLNMKELTDSNPESSVDGILKELIMLNKELANIGTIEKIECFKRFSSNKNIQKACNAYSNINS